VNAPRTSDPVAAPGGLRADLQAFVERAAARDVLVVQPRMGMTDPEAMGAGLRAVAATEATTVGTITVDSYTRVGDLTVAETAVRKGLALNGYPIATHRPEVTRAMLDRVPAAVPVQVRHGSADPRHVFEAMSTTGLYASEGGPVSYCLPYSRMPLAEAAEAWSEACYRLTEEAAAHGRRAHLETFGGCMLGQLCPPSLLVALSVLEAMFFVQRGLRSVSLSYAQQTHAVQDVEALAALGALADEYLPSGIAWHSVLYTYMGVYPRTPEGARLLLESSARVAVRGGAQRLIVKTVAEAHRIPTVEENIAALEFASRAAAGARTEECALPWAWEADYSRIHEEARALIEAALEADSDVGAALHRSFRHGVLDVPYCLHRDNAGRARGAIAACGRLVWAARGSMPLPWRENGGGVRVTSDRLLGMLQHTARTHDHAALTRRAPRARELPDG